MRIDHPQLVNNRTYVRECKDREDRKQIQPKYRDTRFYVETPKGKKSREFTDSKKNH